MNTPLKMDDLNIPVTPYTPSVVTDRAAGTVELRGDSFPENSFAFFTPMMEWVQDYLENEVAPLRLDLYLLYLNTSSVKVMMDLFDLLEDAHGEGRGVVVNWYYDAANERIAELAEEFREDYTFNFEIIQLTHPD